MTYAHAPIDPARMLDAFEQRCRAETRACYAASGNAAEARLAATNQADKVPSAETLTFFHSRVLPGASLRSLAASIVRAGVAVDVTTVSMATALMVRYCNRQAQPVTAHMMHRLFVACILAAAKAHQDKFPCNKLLGKAVGINLSEMNRLEIALTTALDWKFIVTQQDLNEAMAALVPRKTLGASASSDSSYVAADANNASSCSYAGPASRDGVHRGEAASGQSSDSEIEHA